MLEVVPAIIANTPEELKEAIAKLEGKTQRASIDIMDGIFVSDTTTGWHNEISKLNTKINLEIHLMVQEPGEWISNWLSNSQISSISLQAESQGNLKKLLQQIRSIGKRAGLVLNPDTEIESAVPYLDIIDYIQFMAVYPGQYGAPFVKKVIPKIAEFHSKYPDIPIAVDGGITPETAPKVKEVGATILISGSYIMKSDNIKEAINNLLNA